MSAVEILEALMLVVFSIIWYWSITKMLRTKAAAGKSLLFSLMVCFGYGLGTSSKLVFWHEADRLSPLIWVYLWTLCVTAFYAFLVVRFSRVAGSSLAAAPPERIEEADGLSAHRFRTTRSII